MRIGAVAAAIGLPVATIRYYDAVGLLGKVRRGPGGYREFSDEELGRLRFVRQAKAVGLSLAEIATVVQLYDREEATCVHVRALLERKLARVQEALQGLRALQRALMALRDQTASTVDCRPSGGQICGFIERADLKVDARTLETLTAGSSPLRLIKHRPGGERHGN